MVTIGALALAILAFGLLVYCEYHRYWHSSEADGHDQPLENEPDTEMLGAAQLETLTAQYESQHQNTSGLSVKLQAIWRFVCFVLFQSKEQKQTQIRRNDLTAEKLLLEYQTLVRLPGNERVDRFIRWRDDVADYEDRKKAESSLKTRSY